jgi:glycosyltransferase involved in cell wall biosynthesis
LLQLVSDYGLNDQVTFCGWVSAKRKFFDSVKIYVQPSRSETLGLAIREAMALGKPVIVTRCEGPIEYVENAANGILIDIDRPDALADAIETLLDNHQLCDRLGHNARQEMRVRASLQVFSSKLSEFLNKVLIFELINWEDSRAA